jgi:Ca-activated chloride channel family protein
MTFQQPYRLLALAIPLLITVWYLAARARRERVAVRFSAMEAAHAASGRTGGWRRSLGAGLAIVGMLASVVAFARPVMAVQVPVEQATIVLAVDVSLSMAATDISPTRIQAAQEAARRFLQLAPSTLRVGLVAFAGTALPVAPPDQDKTLVTEAINRLGLGQGTAVGEAIFSALDLIKVSQPPEGAPAAIVVLSDGETTMGRPDAQAAQAAMDAGIPVNTIAFGTGSGTVTFQGEVIPVPVNDGALRQIAADTGGSFFQAASESELRSVFDSLESQIAYEPDEVEVTDRFAGLALLAMAVGVALSIRWFDRMA